MVKQTIIFLVLYFCSFPLLVCGEKNILPNFTNSQEPEPGFFALCSRSRSKKIPGAGAALKKKSGAGAAKN